MDSDSQSLLNKKTMAEQLLEFYNHLIGRTNVKPSSLPNNWPYPSEEDLLERPMRLINVGSPQDYSFCTNFVKTSKYEFWNFLPKFLMEEFNPRTKIANCYFLMISAMQCIPAISNTGGIPTTLLPLMFVVLVDAIFQIIEDMARHKADREANASPAIHYDRTLQTFSEVCCFCYRLLYYSCCWCWN